MPKHVAAMKECNIMYLISAIGWSYKWTI